MNLIIGSHVSFRSNNQLIGSVEEALSYKANAFMIYTGAPQNTNRAPINPAFTKAGHELMKTNGIDYQNVMVHAPYIINLANNAGDNNRFAISFLKGELTRVASLGLKYVVLHPGSSVKLTKEEGLINIVNALNDVLNNELDVTILLETMAGKGSEIGNFEDIKYIIDHVNYKDKIGVCLDSCHIHDAGYDITNPDQLFNDFDQIIGLKYLKCVHLNDSKNIKGSHKDRHENIGYGELGFDNIINLVYHPALNNVPIILETPYTKHMEIANPPYLFEIEMLRKKQFNPNLYEDIEQYYE